MHALLKHMIDLVSPNMLDDLLTVLLLSLVGLAFILMALRVEELMVSSCPCPNHMHVVYS